MCTDFDCNPRRPDMVVQFAQGDGDDHVISPRTAAANAFLARKFAQLPEQDLTWSDVNRIVHQARALGFVVEVL